MEFGDFLFWLALPNVPDRLSRGQFRTLWIIKINKNNYEALQKMFRTRNKLWMIARVSRQSNNLASGANCREKAMFQSVRSNAVASTDKRGFVNFTVARSVIRLRRLWAVQLWYSWKLQRSITVDFIWCVWAPISRSFLLLIVLLIFWHITTFVFLFLYCLWLCVSKLKLDTYICWYRFL